MLLTDQPQIRLQVQLPTRSRLTAHEAEKLGLRGPWVRVTAGKRERVSNGVAPLRPHPPVTTRGHRAKLTRHAGAFEGEVKLGPTFLKPTVPERRSASVCRLLLVRVCGGVSLPRELVGIQRQSPKLRARPAPLDPTFLPRSPVMLSMSRSDEGWLPQPQDQSLSARASPTLCRAGV